MTCPKCHLPIESCQQIPCGMLDELPKGRDPLLVERQKTHGSFKDNASISQNIKDAMKRFAVKRDASGCVIEATNTSYNELLGVHREALDMIALKLSRILSGQANFKDHWDDIAGYAKLGAEACE